MPSDYVPPSVGRLRREFSATKEVYDRVQAETVEARGRMERIHKDLVEEERKYDLPLTPASWRSIDEVLPPELGLLMTAEMLGFEYPADLEEARKTIARWKAEDADGGSTVLLDLPSLNHDLTELLSEGQAVPFDQVVERYGKGAGEFTDPSS